MSYIDKVMTTKEASEIYPVADSTLRMWIGDGEFNPEEFRKSGNTWLVTKDSVERVLRKKEIIQREFYLKSDKYIADRLGFKGKVVEVWFESLTTSEMFSKMPKSSAIIDILEIYRNSHKLKFKKVLVISKSKNEDENHNELYTREQVWLMTSSALYKILKEALEYKNIDTTELEIYYANACSSIE